MPLTPLRSLPHTALIALVAIGVLSATSPFAHSASKKVVNRLRAKNHASRVQPLPAPTLPPPGPIALPGPSPIFPIPMPLPGPQPLPQLSQWCDDVVFLLRQRLVLTSMAVQAEDLSAAKKILVQALADAHASLGLPSSLRAPLTIKLITLGRQISATLDATMGNSTQELLAKVNFLAGFVQFVIDQSSQLDVPYYLPYHYQYGACGIHCGPAFDFRALLDRMTGQGRDLLRFTYEHLTIVTYRGIFPAGDPRAFLKVSELVTGFVATELTQNTLSAYVNAGAIQWLRALNRELTAFNSITTAQPDYPTQVAMTYQQLEAIAQSLYSIELESDGGYGY